MQNTTHNSASGVPIIDGKFLCGCGRRYDSQTIRFLYSPGVQRMGDNLGDIKLYNCLCGSTFGVTVSKSSRDKCRQCGGELPDIRFDWMTPVCFKCVPPSKAEANELDDHDTTEEYIGE